MKYEINKLASAYSHGLPTVLSMIQSILQKNKIYVCNVTPISIRFIPWSTHNHQMDQCISGLLSWNSVTKTLFISYHVLLPFKGMHDYLRILKWYLLKWNEEHIRYSRQLSIRFIYPGKNASEIILQASRKTTSASMEKTIRMILLQLNDIIEKEADTILDIIDGDYPNDLKQFILDEVEIVLSELKGEQETKKNEEGINIRSDH